MPRCYTPRGRLITWVVAACFLSGTLGWVVASSLRKSVREEMMLDDVPVMVDYKPSATEQDLSLPLYPGATLENSFSYRVTSKEGKPVTFYASASLTTAEAAERVVEYYEGKLPGKPRPELVQEGGKKRYVLAVASEAEVRVVTIMPSGEGCRIELVRASERTMPPKPLRPKSREDRVI